MIVMWGSCNILYRVSKDEDNKSKYIKIVFSIWMCWRILLVFGGVGILMFGFLLNGEWYRYVG